MAADSLAVIEETHFEGHANLTDGQRSNGLGLAQILRKFKAGRHTFSGAGTEAVAFGEAFADANYTIVFGTDTLATTPEWANKAAGGFDLVSAAAGDVGWVAIHD